MVLLGGRSGEFRFVIRSFTVLVGGSVVRGFFICGLVVCFFLVFVTR